MNELPSQSTLDPAGSGAEQIANLFYVMTSGALIIWFIVVGLAAYAILVPGKHNVRLTKRLVIGCCGNTCFGSSGTLKFTSCFCHRLRWWR